VEQLCSAEGLAEELRREIERVIFEATDPADRLDADSFEHVKDAIRKVDSCWKRLEVVHSSLIDNERWREFADRVSGTRL